MQEKQQATPSTQKWAFRVVRASAIGAGLFVFLQILPGLLVSSPSARPASSASEEPVEMDQNGKIINRADKAVRDGRTRAKELGIATHAACFSEFPGDRQALRRSGCHFFVTEEKHLPSKVKQADWGSGKSTKECLLEVDFYWDGVTNDQREQGNAHAADSWTQRHWVPERRECQNYDNVRISKVVFEPTSRLRAILVRLEAGEKATADDRRVVMADIQTVGAFPENEHKRIYFKLSDRFVQLADGSGERASSPSPSASLPCSEWTAKLAKLKSQEEIDDVTLKSLRVGDVITDGLRWSEIQKARIARTWEWKNAQDGFKTAGCAPGS